MDCVYCGKKTENTLELGRGEHVMEIPCCESCFEEINKLPQSRKEQMSEAAVCHIERVDK